MGFDTTEPIVVVEIGLDYCGNVYGTSPCTATGSAGEECYNTFKTCQDLVNFNRITRWHRFINVDHVAIPRLSDADYAGGFGDGSNTDTLLSIMNDPDILPVKIDPTKGLGERGTVSFTMRDQPWSDLDQDPYVSTRSYTPSAQGTYFGKLKARHFFEGRVMRVYTLDRGSGATISLSSGTRRTYIIERVHGPANGIVHISAIDPLALALNSKAQIPEPSSGLLTTALTADLTDASAIVNDGSQYGATGTVRIGDELCAYIRSGNTLALTRATDNTELQEHSVGDLVQEVEVFDGVTIDQAVLRIMQKTGAQSSWLDSSGWSSSLTPWRTDELTFKVAEPTSCEKLLAEIMVNHSCSFWWDDVDEIFKMEPLRPKGVIDTLDEDNNILEGSLSYQELSEDRVSRVYVYYGQYDPTRDLDDEENWRVVEAGIDLSAESENEYGSKGIRKIFARTIDRNSGALALSLATLTLLQDRDTPEEIFFSLGPSDGNNYRLADVVNLSHRDFQSADGSNELKAVQVVEWDPDEYGGRVKYRAIRFPLAGRFAIYTGETIEASLVDADDDDLVNSSGDSMVGDIPMINFTEANDDERLRFGFYSDDDGLMPDGSTGYGYYPG